MKNKESVLSIKRLLEISDELESGDTFTAVVPTVEGTYARVLVVADHLGLDEEDLDSLDWDEDTAKQMELSRVVGVL